MGSLENGLALARPMSDAAVGDGKGQETDLKDDLVAMETKVRKLRDVRSGHNEVARRAADQRNAVQEQYKELRSELDERLEVVKNKRDEIKSHRIRRDAIQTQVKDLISRAKGQRTDKKEGRSATYEYNELGSEIARMEEHFETSGRVSPIKEKEMMEQMRRMRRRREELEPEVEKLAIIEVDLSDLDMAIKTLRAEADAEHQAMVACIKEANKMSEELSETFERRDFLKSEGDRFHNEFVAEKEKSDAVHQKVLDLMKQVTEVRDKLNAAREERKSWLTDHNASVEQEMQTGAESEEVADSLIASLMEQGSLSIGGVTAKDRGGLSTARKGQKRKGAVIPTARGSPRRK